MELEDLKIGDKIEVFDYDSNKRIIKCSGIITKIDENIVFIKDRYKNIKGYDLDFEMWELTSSLKNELK